eukprot:COSAG06_NODE_12532_length_1368_cov_1.227738_2_plen_97_part_00
MRSEPCSGASCWHRRRRPGLAPAPAEGGGDRGILPTATAVEAADDLGEQAEDYRGEPADDLSGAAGAAGGSTSPMLLPPDLDAGWEPTDLGPIQFA